MVEKLIQEAFVQMYQKAIQDGFGRNINAKDLKVWFGILEDEVTRIIRMELAKKSSSNSSS